MPIRTSRLHALQSAVLILALLARMPTGAQAELTPQQPSQQNQSQNQHRDRQNPATPAADYSGMYSFLRDGEFVQLTIEDHGHVIGFVSRYADTEGDGFLDHFLKSGKLDGNQLEFTSEAVHGVSFEFRGTVERGEGKGRTDEAYYVLRGTLVENTTGETKKTSSHSQEVVLKSFPQELTPPPQAEKK